MNDTIALTSYQFTIDTSIAEWLEQKRLTKSGSDKTIRAYRDTIQQFRTFLARGGLDLLSNPIDIARLADGQEPVLVKCPYCTGHHPEDQIEHCLFNPNRPGL